MRFYNLNLNKRIAAAAADSNISYLAHEEEVLEDGSVHFHQLIVYDVILFGHRLHDLPLMHLIPYQLLLSLEILIISPPVLFFNGVSQLMIFQIHLFFLKNLFHGR